MGDIVIPLAQPYRAFIKEVMEKQIFPLRHYTPDGEIIKPYDITSWSLPLHKGVRSYEINTRSVDLETSLNLINAKYTISKYIPGNYYAAVFNVNNNESYEAVFKAYLNGARIFRLTDTLKFEEIKLPKGSFVIFDQIDEILKELSITPVMIKEKIDLKVKEIKIPKIALVETIFHDMDAGWTRFLLDKYSIPFTILEPKDFKNTDLNDKFDVILFPNNNKAILMEGKYKSSAGYGISNYPPELAKGMGNEGMQNLMKFLDNGGIIISWGMSAELFTGNLKIKKGEEDFEEFKLPVTDLSESLSKKKLYVPGSLIRLKILRDHPLTYGMPEDIGIFSRGKPIFSTSIPRFDMDRRVIGWYPEENLLMSGYAENEDELRGKVGMVWLKKGKGQLVLFGFNPQFRASTEGAYKLLFNAILLEKLI